MEQCGNTKDQRGRGGEVYEDNKSLLPSVYQTARPCLMVWVLQVLADHSQYANIKYKDQVLLQGDGHYRCRHLIFISYTNGPDSIQSSGGAVLLFWARHFTVCLMFIGLAGVTGWVVDYWQGSSLNYTNQELHTTILAHDLMIAFTISHSMYIE